MWNIWCPLWHVNTILPSAVTAQIKGMFPDPAASPAPLKALKYSGCPVFRGSEKGPLSSSFFFFFFNLLHFCSVQWSHFLCNRAGSSDHVEPLGRGSGHNVQSQVPGGGCTSGIMLAVLVRWCLTCPLEIEPRGLLRKPVLVLPLICHLLIGVWGLEEGLRGLPLKLLNSHCCH